MRFIFFFGALLHWDWEQEQIWKKKIFALRLLYYQLKTIVLSSIKAKHQLRDLFLPPVVAAIFNVNLGQGHTYVDNWHSSHVICPPSYCNCEPICPWSGSRRIMKSFFAWGSKPVFYNKATGGVPGLKAGVVESLTAHQTHMHDQQLVQPLQVKVWRHIRNKPILVDNPNIAQDWYFFWMVTWQQGWHSRAHRGRSTGCRRWRRRWGAASSPEEEEETFPWKATYQSWWSYSPWES